MAYTPVDVIEVRVWGSTVGAVTYDPGLGFYAFEYERAWAAGARELAPLTMPNRPTVYAFPALNPDTYYRLPGMLADALPDAFGNAVIDAWLAEQHIDPNTFSSLDRLAYAGDRALGALTFHPVTELPLPVTALQVADIVNQARRTLAGQVAAAETTHDALTQLIQVGSSAGGARAKAVLLYHPDTHQIRSPYAAAEPGFEPWIMKLDGVDSAADGSHNALDAPRDYTRIEYAYSRMATDAGITMSDCRLLPEGPRAHFLTRRFDRNADGTRIHAQSLCAVAHLDFRQRDAHAYAQYLATIRQLNLGNAALEQAYRRIVFNVAAVNRDDHTKNVSFLMDEAGTWQLAPAFDMTHAFNPEGLWTQRHQMNVNGKFEAITRNDLHTLADKHGVPGYVAATKDVLAAVANWRDYAVQAGVSTASITRIHDDMKRFAPR